VAATERPGGILAATLLLPGLAAVTPAAHAEDPPAQAEMGILYGTYRDWQPGLRRISVDSPHLYVMSPFAGNWSFEATHVVDAISGATPRMHTFVSGATPHMSDNRTASEVKITRYFHRAAIGAGAAYSRENDYWSRTKSVEGRWSTGDNNTTFNAGFAESRDLIDAQATGGFAANEHRVTHEYQLGVTQVLTANDIAQVQFTRSIGSGYYSDPYKDFDERPRARRASIVLARWNHHVEPADATLHASWRYAIDTFGIRSHTFGLEWVQPYGRWTLTPGARYYRQGASWFYFDPVTNAAGVPDALLTRLFFGGLSGFHSADARLAAFGAVTVSLKIAYEASDRDVVDLKAEAYRQSSNWRFGGGSPNLQPFRATFYQFGWTHRF
jgi:hypothetical protein